MEIAFELVALALTVLAVTALAARYDAPAPLLLIVVGVAAAYLPFVPTVHLTSDVVLLGLLPPLLYAAAIQTSLVDFNAGAVNVFVGPSLDLRGPRDVVTPLVHHDDHLHVRLPKTATAPP